MGLRVGSVVLAVLLGLPALGVIPEIPCGPYAKDTMDPFGPGAPALADLLTLIGDRKVRSPEELLDAFARAERFRPFLENPVVLPSTEALHREDVTPAFPKLVLNGARLSLQIVGDPRKPTAPLIEILELDPKTRRQHLHLLNFAFVGTKPFLHEKAERLDLKALPAHPSFKGMGRCGACHSHDGDGDSKARFNAGPVWRTPFGRENERIAKGSPEADAWEKFQKTLQDPVLGARYRKVKLGTVTKEPGGDLVLSQQPNTALSKQLTRNNVHRVARLIEEKPRFDALRYAVIAAFFRCEKLEAFLPETVLTARKTELVALWRAEKRDPPDEKKWIEALETHTTEENRSYLQDQFKYALQKPGDPRVATLLKKGEPDAAIAARLRFLFDARGDSNPVASFSIVTSSGYDSFFFDSAGESGLLDVLACGLAPVLRNQSPDLFAFFEGGVLHPAALTIPKETFCGKLREKSLEEGKKAFPSSTKDTPHDGKTPSSEHFRPR